MRKRNLQGSEEPSLNIKPGEKRQPRPPNLPPRHICCIVGPFHGEDITDFVTLMRDTFDPSHFDDTAAAHPLQHELHYHGLSRIELNDSDMDMFEEDQAVFLMQGKRPSSKLGLTEVETKQYLPARPGLSFNSMFPLEGPIRVNRPQNGYRTILTDADLHVLFANCEAALQVLTRLSSQP